jgi:hypothetical protein
MASNIEAAARRLLTLIERDKVCSTDLAIFADIVRECDESNRAKKNFLREVAKSNYQVAGRVFIDDDAVINIINDNSAHVQAWLAIDI